MAFCTVCGWKYDGSPKFCQQCGTPIGTNGGAASAAPPGADPVPPVASMMAAHTPAPGANEAQWITEEHDLWKGKTIDLATGGDFSPNHYRLTTRSLFFSHGRISSTERSVPLWAVRSVTVEESLLDKVRNVGSLIVDVAHDDWTEDIKEVKLEDIQDPQAVRDLILKQVREEVYNYERRKQTMFYKGPPPISPPR